MADEALMTVMRPHAPSSKLQAHHRRRQPCIRGEDMCLSTEHAPARSYDPVWEAPDDVLPPGSNKVAAVMILLLGCWWYRGSVKKNGTYS